MKTHAETLQRNLSILQRKNEAQRAEINRLTQQVEALRRDKAALLDDLKFMRGETA